MIETKAFEPEKRKKSSLELACLDRSCIVIDRKKSLEVAWMGREVLQTKRRDATSSNDKLQPKKR